MPFIPDKPSGFVPDEQQPEEQSRPKGIMSFLGSLTKYAPTFAASGLGGVAMQVAAEKVAVPMIKGIAKPVATAAVTGLAPIEATGRAIGGDIEGAQKRLTEGYQIPGLGQIKPIGAEIGKEGGFVKETRRMIGTGAEFAALLAGGEIIPALGAVAGGVGGFGAAISEENVSPASIFLNTILGTVGGAVLGKMLGPQKIKAGIKAPEPTITAPGLTIKERIAGIEPSTKTLLEGTEPKAALSSFDAMMVRGKEAAINPRSSTPLELAGEKASEALRVLKQKMTSVGEKKTITLKSKAEQPIEGVNEIVSKIDSDIAERFGGQVEVTPDGIRISAAPGRRLKLDETDSNLLRDFYEELQNLGDNPTAQKTDDVIDFLQRKLYKARTNLAQPADKNVISYAKGVLRELNAKQQESIGGSYKKQNLEYAELKKAFDWLNKNLGAEVSKGGTLMKRVFSPADAGTKKTFEVIRQMTGIDLVQEATFAKIAMELAGDARQASLLEQLNVLTRGAGGLKEKILQFGLQKIGKHVADPETVIREMIQGKKILPKAEAAATAKTAQGIIHPSIVDIKDATPIPPEMGQFRKTPFDTKEIVDLRKEAESMLPTNKINTPERQALREKTYKELSTQGSFDPKIKTFTAPIRKEKKAFIVMGPPAAGKSRVFADPLSAEFGARVLDNDMAKERLGSTLHAGLLQDESKTINDRLVADAIEKGENVILPIVGKSESSMEEIYKALNAAGYEIHLKHNHVPGGVATSRAVRRLYTDGRFVDPEYVLYGVDEKTTPMFDKYKKDPRTTSYEARSNDVPKGTPPKLIERSP